MISTASSIILPRDFYNRDTVLVAKELLGKYLVHHIDGENRIGRIVEVEAYVGPHDLACHASKGVTQRTQTLYGPPGHAYVYLIYGIYHCFNVVTEPKGQGAAVLIRAVEPLLNLSLKTNGPGLLSLAYGITKELNGIDLIGERLYLTQNPDKEKFTIIKRPRIGVDYAKHWAKRLLRFYIKDNPYVSKK